MQPALSLSRDQPPRIDETQVEALREHWRRQHFVRLSGFLDPGVLAFVERIKEHLENTWRPSQAS